MRKTHSNLQGFTLIEILVVIGLIAILAAVTIIAINPAQNFQDARNAERDSETTQILNAVSQWVVAGGSLSNMQDAAGTPNAFNPTNAPCGTYTATDGWAVYADLTASAADQIELSAYVADPAGVSPNASYMAEIPEDPQDATAGGASGYRICSESATRLSIFAPLAEGTTIVRTR